MKRTIELKHVGPKDHVRRVLEELITRLEDRLRHFPEDAVSLHVLFEENGSHELFRTSVTCHVPKHLVAAHEENRDPGVSIRKAFAEIERQLEKRQVTRRLRNLRHHAELARRAAAMKTEEVQGVEE